MAGNGMIAPISGKTLWKFQSGFVLRCNEIGHLSESRKFERGGWKMSEQAPQRSRELFQSGFFCAESVLQAIAESQGIQSDLIPGIATGFCSGVSRTGGMCGAISGAIMGINLVTGRNSPAGSLEVNYAMIQKLIGWFEKQYGSINCRQLLGCDLASEIGQRYFMENHLMESCLQYAEGATSMALSLIEKKTNERA
jgi:C_GCAxxG_C_C family probable redox protein